MTKPDGVTSMLEAEPRFARSWASVELASTAPVRRGVLSMVERNARKLRGRYYDLYA